MKLYLDTNIFIDAIEHRFNKKGKDIGNPDADLLVEAISCKFKLVISSWTLEELRKVYNIEKLSMFFIMAKKKINIIHQSKEDELIANEKSGDNFDDALHIVLAEKENADCIVTRNLKHFWEIGSIIDIKKPEELI